MDLNPDFLDNWKTILLTDILEDKCAPTYLLRLLSYFEIIDSNWVPLKHPAMLKAICRAPHDFEVFNSALVESCIVDIINGSVFLKSWNDLEEYDESRMD